MERYPKYSEDITKGRIKVKTLRDMYRTCKKGQTWWVNPSDDLGAEEDIPIYRPDKTRKGYTVKWVSSDCVKVCFLLLIVCAYGRLM